MNKTRIMKWGNWYGIKVPKKYVELLGLFDGDAVMLIIENEKIVIKPISSINYSLDELISKITPENFHTEIDFGPRVGREFW